MTDRAVVYVTDPDFLVPTIVSALQLRKQVAQYGLADVIVFLAGFPEAQVGPVGEILLRLGLGCDVVPDVHLPDDIVFRKNHVPVSSLARFRLPEVLPAQYRHVVYIDGDTQIVGDIRPLVRHTVQIGKIAAAETPVWMIFNRQTRFPNTYFKGIELGDPGGYFNSGVFACRRETMDEMFPRALDYFLKNSGRCLYHD